MAAIVAAAEMAGSLYREEQRRKELREADTRALAEFSSLLSANNGVLVREMASSIHDLLNEEKLEDCMNKLATLSIFLDEYRNNPSDFAKLSLIEQQAQYALDILNDPDLESPGIHLYAGVASLRISSLLLKSNFQPGDLENAKGVAQRAALHVYEVKSKIDSINWYFRINCQSHSTEPPFDTPGLYIFELKFLLDGTVIFEKRTEPTMSKDVYNRRLDKLMQEAEEFRRSKALQIKESIPTQDLDAVLEEWKMIT